MNFKNAYLSVFLLNCKIHGLSHRRNCLKMHVSLSQVTLAACAASAVCSDSAVLKSSVGLLSAAQFCHCIRINAESDKLQFLCQHCCHQRLLQQTQAVLPWSCTCYLRQGVSDTAVCLRCVLHLSWRCSHSSVAGTLCWSLTLEWGFAGGWGDGGDLLPKEFGEWLSWLFSLNSAGTNLRGMKQAMYDGLRMEQELSDAEIARKLQEEELLVSGEGALVNSRN